jgi:hypothetical protein
MFRVASAEKRPGLRLFDLHSLSTSALRILDAGVLLLDQALCNANVSLTDLIKGWFVALTKQLNA